MMNTKYFSIVLMFISPAIMALPKVTVSFGESANGFSQVNIKNETTARLACFIAIDGHKSKFQLTKKSTSSWFTATDKRFNHQNFSTWCDYLEVHPKYRAYPVY